MLTLLKKIGKEIKILVINLPYFRYLKVRNKEDAGLYDGMCVNTPRVSNPVKHTNTIGYMFDLPRNQAHLTKGMHVLQCGKGDPQERLWFYINGMMTTREAMAVNLQGLNSLLGQRVTGIYNPTEGIVKDLLESIIGRSSTRFQTVSRVTAAFLTFPILTKQPITIIGHSQGAIILSNVVKILLASGFDLDHVEFITIGGAHDEFSSAVFSEHFGNEKDYIYRTGARAYKDEIAGKQYERNATGHLLNSHYLEGLYRGDYCNKTSRLYRHIKKL